MIVMTVIRGTEVSACPYKNRVSRTISQSERHKEQAERREMQASVEEGEAHREHSVWRDDLEKL